MGFVRRPTQTNNPSKFPWVDSWRCGIAERTINPPREIATKRDIIQSASIKASIIINYTSIKSTSIKKTSFLLNLYIMLNKHKGRNTARMWKNKICTFYFSSEPCQRTNGMSNKAQPSQGCARTPITNEVTHLNEFHCNNTWHFQNSGFFGMHIFHWLIKPGLYNKQNNKSTNVFSISFNILSVFVWGKSPLAPSGFPSLGNHPQYCPADRLQIS